MKIALAVWKNRISPVFDSARALIVAEVENETINNRKYIHIQTHMPHNRAVELFELGVNVLICGAISRIYEKMIELQGIKVIPFIAGNVNQVIESYLKGKLNSRNFRMPGCGNMCRKRFRGEIQ